MPITYKSLDKELKASVNASLTRRGKTIYVHANDGSDGDNGRTWDSAYLTMAKAFTALSSGDTIIFAGKIREQLTAPALVFDVTIIGAGNRPRHADDSPTPVGGKSANTWTTPSSAAATTPLLTQKQQGWKYVNILFAGPSDDACVELTRTEEGAAEQDCSHTEFIDCRFASGYDGIRDSGGCNNILVQNCRFEALTNFAIIGVGNIGVGQSNWKIVDNTFDEFTNGIKIAAFGCRIQNNTFTEGGTPATTVVLNTSNGGGSKNFVVHNYFQGTTANFNSPDVVGNATDVWMENYAIDSTSAGVGGNFEAGQPAG